MWRVEGLEDVPNNDKRIYPSFQEAYLEAPTPSYIYKVEIIEL